MLTLRPAGGGPAGLTQVVGRRADGVIEIEVVGLEGRPWAAGAGVRLRWHGAGRQHENDGVVVADGAGGRLVVRLLGPPRPASADHGVEVPFPFPVRFSRLGRDIAAVRRRRRERMAVHVGSPQAIEPFPLEGRSDAVREALVAVAKLLLALEARLDRLEAVIRNGPGAEPPVQCARGLLLGSDRVRMATEAGVEPGEVIELEFRLPMFPPVPLLAFAWVSGVGVPRAVIAPPSCGQAVEAEFVGLHEEDEALLMAYLLRRQREALRGRRWT